MATLAIDQMQFPFMPPPAPLPTELHNLKHNAVFSRVSWATPYAAAASGPTFPRDMS